MAPRDLPCVLPQSASQYYQQTPSHLVVAWPSVNAPLARWASRRSANGERISGAGLGAVAPWADPQNLLNPGVSGGIQSVFACSRTSGVPRAKFGESHGEKMLAPVTDSRSSTKRPGLQGMPGDGGDLGSPAPLPFMRARRLLRRLQEQACYGALPKSSASDHPVLRT